MSYSIQDHSLTGTTLAAHLGAAAVTSLTLDLRYAVDLTGPPADAAKAAINAAYDAIVAHCSENEGQYLCISLILSDNAGMALTQLDCVLSAQSLQVLGYCVGNTYWEMQNSNYSLMSSPSKISRDAIVAAQHLFLTPNRLRLSSAEGQQAACLIIFCVSEAARELTARAAVISAMLPYYYRASIDARLAARHLSRSEPYHTLTALWNYSNHSIIMNNWQNIVMHRDAALAPAYRFDVPITLADARAFHAGSPESQRKLDQIDIQML